MKAPILHFTSRSQWQQAQDLGYYKSLTFEEEGFIHCSTADQVCYVANLIASDQKDLVLLVLDVDRVNSKIITENLDGGTNLFPHIYGHINLEAVTEVLDFVKVEGKFILPAGLEEFLTS